RREDRPLLAGRRAAAPLRAAARPVEVLRTGAVLVVPAARPAGAVLLAALRAVPDVRGLPGVREEPWAPPDARVAMVTSVASTPTDALQSVDPACRGGREGSAGRVR